MNSDPFKIPWKCRKPPYFDTDFDNDPGLDHFLLPTHLRPQAPDLDPFRGPMNGSPGDPFISINAGRAAGSR